MSITVLGVNYLTAPLDVRERFTLAASEVPETLNRVIAAGAAGGVVLSTCNRTEFYLADPGEPAPQAVWGLLTDRLGDGRRAHDYGYVRLSRALSVSSIRKINCPLFWRARSHANSAVRAAPTCNKPVGLGAKRVLVCVI